MTNDLSCLLCGTAALTTVGVEAFRCDHCGILINRTSQPLDYADGGGQAVPDANKMRWRLTNARMRWALIAPWLAGHSVFVDIGCGSGEMLEAAAERFPYRFGFEPNVMLVRYARQRSQAAIFETAFDPALIPAELADKGKVLSISHVLEHLGEPMALVKTVVAAMRSGDLLYIEVPLHTGQSFREQGYLWALWNHEHTSLYSREALELLAKSTGLETVHRGTRIFARGSHSSKTRLRLFFQGPLRFVHALATKGPHSVADVLVADYGCVVLRKP
jgi:SAM-dependent methyltransferase